MYEITLRLLYITTVYHLGTYDTDRTNWGTVCRTARRRAIGCPIHPKETSGR